MSTTVVLVVLGAGLVHAVWNALTKSLHDQSAGFALLNLSVALVSWVALTIVGLPRSASWVYLRLSIFCHLGDELLLMGAYRRAAGLASVDASRRPGEPWAYLPRGTSTSLAARLI